MANAHTGLDPVLSAYIAEVSRREPEILARLRAETAELPLSIMQVSPEQGQFLRLLVLLTGARRLLELGTFTGYSALAMARALPAEGRLVTCDIDTETTAVAQRYWHEAGVAGCIELRLGPALETLAALESEGAGESFDIAFIDADKTNIQAYFDAALGLLRPGGLILVDNVLWNGAVADPDRDDADTRAIQAFNRTLKTDSRVDLTLLPFADGLTLARKRCPGDPMD